MSVIKTKHFESSRQRPKIPTDGTSLEEQMNTFFATLTIIQVKDVMVEKVAVGQTRVFYTGLVTYST